ncbi:YceI family protein [Leptospira fluminis]|uniref:YceI family protein n=1 Tax=Leptospira fluminis TaxID=2484979 RepID=A0A4R9GM77_9LEPT|nr:YceI family protein [Leptospira fluminis]TGK15351.1 YceI family protein [Leptospira fluminis]
MNSGSEKRDNHLADPEFFDIAKFPEAIYHIDSVRLTGDTLAIKGRLSLHGVERPLDLDLQRKKDTSDLVLVGETTLQQKDFGMVYSSLINPIKSEVALKFHIVLTKK